MSLSANKRKNKRINKLTQTIAPSCAEVLLSAQQEKGRSLEDIITLSIAKIGTLNFPGIWRMIVKELLSDREYKTKELANIINVSDRTIIRIAKGKTHMPSNVVRLRLLCLHIREFTSEYRVMFKKSVKIIKP